MDANISNYAPIWQTLSSAKPSISNVLKIQPGSKNVILLVTPLRNTEGKIVGVVGGQIDPTGSTLREFTSPVALGETSHIDVIDSNGLVLASSDPQLILRRVELLTGRSKSLRRLPGLPPSLT